MQIKIVYWRDIPAQVLARSGRKRYSRQLPERFEKAIDAAAMKINASGTDAYLAEWRKEAVKIDTDDPEAAIAQIAEHIIAQYGSEKLKRLVANGGRKEATP